MNSFVVTLYGRSKMCIEHLNVMLIDDTSDETLDRVRKIFLKLYNLEVCGFTKRGEGLHAFTCTDGMDVFIERIDTIECLEKYLQSCN